MIDFTLPTMYRAFSLRQFHCVSNEEAITSSDKIAIAYLLIVLYIDPTSSAHLFLSTPRV